MDASVGEVIYANCGGQCFVPVRTLASFLEALSRGGQTDTTAFWRDAIPPISQQLVAAKSHPYELELEAEGALAYASKTRDLDVDQLRAMQAGMAVSTSPGPLDAYLSPRNGPLKVCEPFMCTSNGGSGTAVATFGAWTHDGQFTVCGSFHDGALDSDLIASIADRVIALLVLVSR